MSLSQPAITSRWISLSDPVRHTPPSACIAEAKDKKITVQKVPACTCDVIWWRHEDLCTNQISAEWSSYVRIRAECSSYVLISADGWYSCTNQIQNDGSSCGGRRWWRMQRVTLKWNDGRANQVMIYEPIKWWHEPITSGTFPRDVKLKILWVEPRCPQGFLYQFCRFVSTYVCNIHNTSRSSWVQLGIAIGTITAFQFSCKFAFKSSSRSFSFQVRRLLSYSHKLSCARSKTWLCPQSTRTRCPAD